MSYDRYGRAKPTPRDGVPGRAATVAVCIFVVAFLALCVWLGERGSEPEPSQSEPASVRHDSLAPTYTYDGQIIRWYVFVDPDTQAQYLYSDHGHCTPRLDRHGIPMGTIADESD